VYDDALVTENNFIIVNRQIRTRHKVQLAVDHFGLHFHGPLQALRLDLGQRSSPTKAAPVVLEVHAPAWIMALLYADSIAAGLARNGEIKLEAESGLNELRAEWHNLTKRVIPL